MEEKIVPNILQSLENIFFSKIKLGNFSLPFNLFTFILEFIIPLVLAFLFYRLLLAGIKKILSSSKAEEPLRNRIIKISTGMLRIFLIIFFIICIGWLFGAEIFKYLGIFFSFLKTPLIVSGGTSISFVTLILLIPIFYTATWLGRLANKVIENSLISRMNLEESKRFTLSRLISYFFITAFILFGLSLVGIDISALTVLFGVLGIGLGFGLQNVVANFFAGVVILFSRPIKEGDRILLNDYEGTVQQVKLLSSVINTLTEETIIVPNSLLVNNIVYNYTFSDRRIIIKNTIQVSYSSDLEEVLGVLDEISKKNPYREPEKDPITRVSSFDDSGITVGVFTWIRDVVDKYAAISWTNMEIWRHFKEHNIEIPFPQMDVHIKK